MKEQLISALAEALQALGISNPLVMIDHPEQFSFGEYMTNVALVYAKEFGKNPKQIAEEIVTNLQGKKLDGIAEITVAGPGFINFKLTKESIRSETDSLLNKIEKSLIVSLYEGKKILVEHSSPNLFKPFHVGHMMNNAIGESLVRLFSVSGGTVIPTSFPSDVGLGIAKAVYATLESDHEILHDDRVSLEDKMKFLGERYVEGTKAYDENPEAAEEIKKINNEIYQGLTTPAYDLYEFTKKLNIEYFQETVARLGTTFDSYIFEGEAGVVGESLVRAHIGNVFVESEGALIYIPAEETHLNTEVFLTSAGHPTYGSKDLGLLKLKFDRYQPDLSIVVTDYQQAHHFHVVLDAARRIHPEWYEKSVHVPHGRMAFKGQKMSSRLGGVPVATEVLELISGEVRERGAERNLPQSTQDQIAIGAIKFSILRVKPGGAMNFDPETSLSFEGDSGPYLQYTCARIQSLISKGVGQGIEPKISETEAPSDIEKMILRFPESVERAIKEFAPQHIATYALSLAREFNSFYGSTTILDAEQKEISSHRLFVSQSAFFVLRKCLWLLGIETPKEM
jgi:arginyl-tRNA synthetase